MDAVERRGVGGRDASRTPATVRSWSVHHGTTVPSSNAALQRRARTAPSADRGRPGGGRGSPRAAASRRCRRWSRRGTPGAISSVTQAPPTTSRRSSTSVRSPAAGEVERGGEPVVAAADHDHVVARGGGVALGRHAGAPWSAAACGGSERAVSESSDAAGHSARKGDDLKSSGLPPAAFPPQVADEQGHRRHQVDLARECLGGGQHPGEIAHRASGRRTRRSSW